MSVEDLLFTLFKKNIAYFHKKKSLTLWQIYPHVTVVLLLINCKIKKNVVKRIYSVILSLKSICDCDIFVVVITQNVLSLLYLTFDISQRTAQWLLFARPRTRISTNNHNICWTNIWHIATAILVSQSVLR